MQGPSQHLQPWACQAPQYLNPVVSGSASLTKVCLTWNKKRRLPVTHLRNPTRRSRKLWLGTFREAWKEAFLKDSEVVKMAWWNYCKAYRAIFEHEGSHNLTSMFQQMSRDTNLLVTEIHEVQEVWTGCQGLKATNHPAKASQRDIQFFHMVMPKESPNIMELKGIHSPEPYIGKVVPPSAPGVERKVRIRAQLWTICEPCTTTWAWYVPSVWTFHDWCRHYEAAHTYVSP